MHDDYMTPGQYEFAETVYLAALYRNRLQLLQAGFPEAARALNTSPSRETIFRFWRRWAQSQTPDMVARC